MRFGRKEECARIAAMVDAARNRRSGSLVLRGEAGVGKTALLEYAIERAKQFRVLRAIGVESEAEIAFAGLQQLLRPILHALADLPGPQANALRTALAIEDGRRPERLAVSVAALGLLAAAAEDQPLLCVIDDAHWLDHASAEALTFAARRMEAEAVVMLFAAREPETTTLSAPGVPELRLRGLPPSDALAMLAATAPGLARQAADRLVVLTGGNPLALLEITSALSTETLEGRKLIEEPLPVDADTERSFFERAAALSAEARSALLLIAAADPEDPDALRRALAAEAVEASAVAEAEAAGLLERGRASFCHPLARSAVYQSAPPADQRAAHAALGAATTEPDRRAWHLAAAAEHPDEGVAALLEEAANAARRRGGVAAEAKALDRAARLSPDRQTGARRLYKAALAAEAAGWLSYAEVMLRDAADVLVDASLRAHAIARRSYLLFDRGEFDRAWAIAAEAADRAEPEEAAVLLSASGAIHVCHHRLDIPRAVATAERAWRLAGSPVAMGPDLCFTLAWTRALSGRSEDALSLLRSTIDRIDPTAVVAIDLGSALLYLEDYPRAREVLERVVRRTREAYASGTLSYALSQLAKVELRTGNLTRAYALELESHQLTGSLGNDVELADNLAWLSLMESMLGRSESRAHAESALAIAEGRQDRWNAVRARAALGFDALAHGEVAEAVRWLQPAAAMTERGGVGHPNFFRVNADLVEALARLGQTEEAGRLLARLEAQAESTGSFWGHAAAARCRALLSPVADIREAFETALERHDCDPSGFERARTELCYGERLRRAGQRKSAREHLRTALDAFERAGAPVWAERARTELQASGEHLSQREATTAERLTPQELQIALLVSEGLSNRDMGARLFLSLKTVEFHLTRIYRKLQIHSRSELVRLMIERNGPG